ncbi:hypothetical protein SUGI_0211670 [Cryptomeria japonica]|nr:hypothetical protein SUGI_0211670 [Cryptomeria japonica]
MQDGADKIEQSCQKLFSIMGTRKLSENQHLRPAEGGWMETMSSIFKAIADIKICVDMEDAFEAYRETQDVLKFVDCPDNIVEDNLNIFGTLNVIDFASSINWEGKICKLEKKLKQGLRTSLEEERERVRVITPEERERVDEMLREFKHKLQRSCEGASNSLLIRLEECSYYNLVELGDMLRALVGHVIVSSVLEARESIVKHTKQWVRNIDERKIKRAIELAVKVSALLENLVEDEDILFSNL